MARRFEFSEGSSNKFWEVAVEGANLVVRFGKLGASGQTSLKAFGDAAAAQKAADALIAEKTRKGYLEVGGAKAATAPSAKPKAVRKSAVKKGAAASPAKPAATGARAAHEAILKKIRCHDELSDLHDDDLAVLAEVISKSSLGNVSFAVDKDGHVEELGASTGPGRKLGGSLAGLTRLTSLVIDGYQANTVAPGFFAVPTLTTVDLEHCLRAFPPELFKLKALTALRFVECGATLPKDLKVDWPRLESLELTGNKISAVPAAFLSLTSLKELWLSENPVTELGGDWSKLKKLTVVALSQCKLTEFPAALLKVPTLETITLVDNACTSLPDAIGTLKNLKGLFLGRNKLKAIPDSLLKLTKIEELTLGGNQLEALPDLSKLTKLKKLSIKDNKLKVIDPTLKKRIAEYFDEGNPVAGAKLPSAADFRKLLEDNDEPWAAYKKCLGAIDRADSKAAKQPFVEVAVDAIDSILSDMDEHGDANIDMYGGKPESFFKKERTRLQKLLA